MCLVGAVAWCGAEGLCTQTPFLVLDLLDQAADFGLQDLRWALHLASLPPLSLPLHCKYLGAMASAVFPVCLLMSESLF